MKYIWLVLFLAAVFGLCFFADRCIGKVQARAQRRPAVRLPLRYPLLCVRGRPASRYFPLRCLDLPQNRN